MSGTIFLAGAAGAIGSRLAPLLIAGGWRVVGTTRSPDKAACLRALGVEPVIVDVFDAAALAAAVSDTAPGVVIHQLTDLPPGLDPARMDEATSRNARIRDEGTRNLVGAATAAGARRFIAQSVAFAYAEAALPYAEENPLAVSAEGRAGLSARAAGAAPLHVDAAAKAAALAVTHGAPGIYNLAEDDGTVTSEKAKRAFAWSADWRMPA